jgi:hypothetical protein
MSVDDPNDTSTWTTFWVKIWHGDPVDLKGQEALNYIKENTAPLRGIFHKRDEILGSDALEQLRRTGNACGRRRSSHADL